MDDRGNASPTEAFMSKKKNQKPFDVESGRVKAEREVNCRKVSRSAEVYQTAQTSKPIRTLSNITAEIWRVDRHQERGESQGQELLEPLPCCAREQ